MGAAVKAAATAAILGVLFGSGAQALAVEDCTRLVRGWNGWEVQHRDIGGGRVAFAEKWAGEGVYVDLIVSDCASGETVRTRVHEEMIAARPAFVRTKAGLAVIERHARRSPALFSIGALADDLSDIGEDTAVFIAAVEICACAALYPALRGDKTAFEGV